ncbi:hypothetical protein BDR04DRAFT_1188248 [Suillus decipiens]|nr:hypothetical protein BDR04DRAFT_1188248 [Suillus decipiens]
MDRRVVASGFRGCLLALTARLSHHVNPSACPSANGVRHKLYALRSSMSSSPHHHCLATASAVLTMNSNGRPFDATVTASLRHLGWRKSAREWRSVFITWNRRLKIDFACIQKPLSASLASS